MRTRLMLGLAVATICGCQSLAPTTPKGRPMRPKAPAEAVTPSPAPPDPTRQLAAA